MATIIRKTKVLTFTAVDAVPLDGSTTDRTYQAKDREVHAAVIRTAQSVTPYITLDEETDAVTIVIDGTGADGNTAVFSIYGYGEDGPAERIYHTVTATLGTAVAGSSRKWAEVFSGTSTHTKTIGITDSVAAGNSMAKISFDTTGLRYLYFEPKTFTTLTTIAFHVREWGSK
ncbi:hypothetical protein LCGC14_1798770 [marine sediment metagenome]|uniref:Uncharacterized protein n=1 Tax=marine sediment metagenome TaxID=412755 RepID=A0A0F9HCY6_9ZZZZ